MSWLLVTDLLAASHFVTYLIVLLSGFSLAGLTVLLSFRRKLERQQFAHEANARVVQNQLQNKLLEIDNLNFRIQEVQLRLAEKNNALSKTTEAEAEYKIQSAELQIQTNQQQSQIEVLTKLNTQQQNAITLNRRRSCTARGDPQSTATTQ